MPEYRGQKTGSCMTLTKYFADVEVDDRGE